MNILFDLQLSVLDSLDDGKFLFTPDSNVNVATFTLKGLCELLPDATFYVLAPSPEKTVHGLEFTDKLDASRVKVLAYDYFGNPFMDRMNFDARSINKALNLANVKFDLVYTNDPCKVLPYKTLFYYRQKSFIPVISRNHWVSGITDRKVPEQIDFVMRQVEGARYGDWMTFNSKYAIELFKENAKEFYNFATIEGIEGKLEAFETVDVDKVDMYRTEQKPSKFTILWGHRLSYYTGWEETFNWLLEYWEKNKEWQMICPDPGNKFTQEELHKRWPFIKPIDKSSWTHEKYLTLCWMSDVVLGNHNYPATWGGLSMTEPMAARTVPVMPNRHSYKEMFYRSTPDEIYMYEKFTFFENKEDFLKCIEFWHSHPDALEHQKSLARKFCKEELSMKKFNTKIAEKIRALTVQI